MKSKNYIILVMLLMLSVAKSAMAQCPGGQSEVTIIIETDGYGYEGYWEMVPSGNACGVGTILSGGNAVQVGCTGGGLPATATAGNGYGNSTTVTTTPTCYPTGTNYDIKYIDDYGDGGFNFTVKINGFPIYSFSGDASLHTFTFNNTPPPAFDLGITKLVLPMYAQSGNHNITGTIFNYGSTTITSFDLNYSVNSGANVTQTISGVSIPGYTSYNFVHPTPWNAITNGTYNIDVWATNLNGGNSDTNTTNDHKNFTIVIGDPIPNIIDDYLTAGVPYITTIANASKGVIQPRDLDFHPVLSRNELWVVLKSTEAIGGKTAKISNAGLPSQTVLVQKDGNAWHFMSLPTGIAFSDNGNFCTSPGVLDANHGTGHFTGPALWNSDPLIYAQPSGGNGSHIDMLHQCPYAMGVTWESENIFWVYDGYNGDLMRCDFQNDHGPGNDDHSDGRIRSYDDLSVGYNDLDVPCHMALDQNKQWLYVVNGTDNMVYRMDITTGSQTGTFTPYAETLAEHSIYTGTNNSVYISSGITQPCGIDIIGDRLIVGDYANGDIIIYDCSGTVPVEKGRIVTGAPGIQGIKIGPDGKIWYVNNLTNEVKRVDLSPNSISEKDFMMNLNVSPNPSNDEWNITCYSKSKIINFSLADILGGSIQLPNLTNVNGNNISIKIPNYNLASGVYLLKIKNEFTSKTIRLIKK